MSSEARRAFDANTVDIDRLLELHEQEGGPSRGRRYGLEVLNKSAIVLITAYWEAYCEDIASEGLDHLVKHAADAASLPVELRRQIAKELKTQPNELSVWEISGDGWRSLLQSRLNVLHEERSRRLNTPKSANIDELFMKALGISKLSDSWHWVTKMTPARARAKLDKYVTLRGAIAHRGKDAGTVRKSEVKDYFEFVKKLVSKTGGKVNVYVRAVTGTP